MSAWHRHVPMAWCHPVCHCSCGSSGASPPSAAGNQPWCKAGPQSQPSTGGEQHRGTAGPGIIVTRGTAGPGITVTRGTVAQQGLASPSPMPPQDGRVHLASPPPPSSPRDPVPILILSSSLLEPRWQEGTEVPQGTARPVRRRKRTGRRGRERDGGRQAGPGAGRGADPTMAPAFLGVAGCGPALHGSALGTAQELSHPGPGDTKPLGTCSTVPGEPPAPASAPSRNAGRDPGADPHRGEAKEPTRWIPSWGAAPGVEGLGALGDWGHWEGMGQRAP